MKPDKKIEAILLDHEFTLLKRRATVENMTIREFVRQLIRVGLEPSDDDYDSIFGARTTVADDTW